RIEPRTDRAARDVGTHQAGHRATGRPQAGLGWGAHRRQSHGAGLTLSFKTAGAAAIIVGARTVASLIKGRPLAEKLNGFLLVFPRLARQRRLLVACVVSSSLNWFLSMLQLWMLLHAFGAQAPLTLAVAILPAATFAGLLPIPTFAGAGPRDAALLYLTLNRVDPAAMLAASIVYTFFGYFLLGLAGLPFLKELTRQERDASPGQ
ncbi:MAG TPA: lysylphosphatidylglycerol synthase transmembrane domain-containing protein, partial [Candidatus Sumerlaeota bacterium]|nr:lysylphosphatidylglycerol synthase transmembrane domain-containing protein [Candidatus Sumerlaeota bacterium]